MPSFFWSKNTDFQTHSISSVTISPKIHVFSVWWLVYLIVLLSSRYQTSWEGQIWLWLRISILNKVHFYHHFKWIKVEQNVAQMWYDLAKKNYLCTVFYIVQTVAKTHGGQVPTVIKYLTFVIVSVMCSLLRFNGGVSTIWGKYFDWGLIEASFVLQHSSWQSLFSEANMKHFWKMDLNKRSEASRNARNFFY